MDKGSTVTYVPWAEVEHLFEDRISPIGGSAWCGNTLHTPQSGTLVACASMLADETARTARVRAHLAHCPAREGLACFICGAEGQRS